MTKKKIFLDPTGLFIAFSQIKMKSLKLDSMDTRSKHSHQKPSRNYHFTGFLPFEHITHPQREILCSYPDTVFTTPPFVSQIRRAASSKISWFQSRKDESDSDRSKQACKMQSCNGIFCEYIHTQYRLLCIMVPMLFGALPF